MHEAILTYENVSLSYHGPSGETAALESVNLAVKRGEFLAVLGPSGCGKSTLLSLASGLLTPDDGEVTLFGEPVKGPSQRVGYMLQRDHLFAWRDIERNAMLGLEVRGAVTAQGKQRVNDLLHSCGLWDFRKHFPKQLSGGMRQRAALVRTLAVEPEVLLLDEPFSALDALTRVKLSDEVGQIIREQNRTAVLVTHDVSEAVSMADRVVILTHRPAQIKSEHIIDMPGTALARRGDARFKEHFEHLWQELDVKTE